MRNHISFYLLLITGFAFGQNRFPYLKFVDEYIIDTRDNFNGTVAGGFSGIDYFSKDIFYFISDDPGKQSEPRFYKAKIRYTKKGIKKFTLTDVKYLQAPAGKTFTASHNQTDTSKFLYSDGESIRYDKENNLLLWTSEGYNNKGSCMQPFIFSCDTNGKFVRKIYNNPVFSFSNNNRGSQHNAAFEAMDVIPGTNSFIYCTEKNLYEDVNPGDSARPVRITIAGKVSGATKAQFAYIPENIFDDGSTGVSEILALSVDSFLVLERTTNKEDGNVVRLFLATTGGTSSDIKNTRELKSEKYIPLQKNCFLTFQK